MAGERIEVRGTQTLLTATALAATANNAISAAADTTYTKAVSGSVDFPHAEFVLSTTFGTAPTVNTALELIGRPINVDSTTDTPAPTASYKNHLVLGYFTVLNSTSAQTLTCTVFDLPFKEMEFYVYNNATGQTTGTMTLKITPLSYKQA